MSSSSETLDRDRDTRDERRVREQKRDVRRLARALTAAEERERQRIAEGLHDDVGPLLAAARLRLGLLSRATDPKDLASGVEMIGELLDKAMHATRSLVFDLGCPELREDGLYVAIRRLGEEIASRHDLRFSFLKDDRSGPPDGDLAVILFRAVRELLLNVVKHAGAASAEVAVARANGWLRVTVTDDGSGFDPKKTMKTKGFGLLSTRERLGRLGGRLEIESAPGLGTRVVLTAPLTPADSPVGR